MAYSEITRKELKPRLWEYLFAIFTLFLSTGAVIPLLQKNSGVVFNSLQGNVMLQVLWLGVYGITALLWLLYPQQIQKKAFKDKPLWVLVGAAFLSTVWSVAPLVTLRGSAALLGTTMFGIYLATRYTKEDLIKLLAWALGVSAVLSLGFVMFLPSYGLQSYNRLIAWQGIYVNKNNLGCFMALSAITWLIFSLISTSKAKRLGGLCFCGFSLVLLYFSKSTTSLVIFFMLLIITLFYLICRHYKPRLRLLFTFILIFSTVCLIIGLISNIDISLTAMGKDATISGRTKLWYVVWQMIQQRPWLGYGYNAFWLEWNGPSRAIWRVLTWNPPHAHNGYLDVWLQIGFVGLVLFILSFAINFYRAIINVLRNDSIVKMFTLLILTFLLVHNITESTILKQNNIFWVLYTAVTTQLSGERSGKS